MTTEHRQLQDLEARLYAEVEAVHAFIADWFTGGSAKDQRTFDESLTHRFSPDMQNIQPNGRVRTKEELLQTIFDGHGANRAFTIAIRDFRLLSVSSNCDVAIATYVEDQRNAKNTVPPDNLRRSTVVFRIADDAKKITWQHIHETATE